MGIQFGPGKGKKKQSGDLNPKPRKATTNNPQADFTVRTMKANASKAPDNSYLPDHIRSQGHGLQQATHMTVTGKAMSNGTDTGPSVGSNDEIKRRDANTAKAKPAAAPVEPTKTVAKFSKGTAGIKVKATKKK